MEEEERTTVQQDQSLLYPLGLLALPMQRWIGTDFNNGEELLHSVLGSAIVITPRAGSNAVLGMKELLSEVKAELGSHAFRGAGRRQGRSEI